jgi:site-specific DNA recombinase
VLLFSGGTSGCIKEHILTTENLTKLVDMINEEIDGMVEDYQERLEGIAKETADIDYRLERLYDAIETGKIQIADLAPRISLLRLWHDRLQANRLELETQLSDRKVELADVETVALYVADLRSLLSESELVEKKSFVRSFMKEVKVTDVEVLVTYTLPLLPKVLTEEKFPVLSIGYHGGPL